MGAVCMCHAAEDREGTGQSLVEVILAAMESESTIRSAILQKATTTSFGIDFDFCLCWTWG